MFDKFQPVPDFNSAAFVVRAMIREQGEDKPSESSFAAHRIDRIRKINDDVSEILLKSGIIIPVMMPFATLEKNLYLRDLRDGNVLDLCACTGDIYKDPDNIKLTVVARKSASQMTDIFSFYEKDMRWSQREGYDADHSKIKVATKIPLVDKEDPFGGSDVIIDIPVNKLEALFAKAKKQRQPELDLREWQTLEPGHDVSDLSYFTFD